MMLTKKEDRNKRNQKVNPDENDDRCHLFAASGSAEPDGSRQRYFSNRRNAPDEKNAENVEKDMGESDNYRQILTGCERSKTGRNRCSDIRTEIKRVNLAEPQ